MKEQIHQRNHNLYEIFRIMITMLSRDGPFDSNLKDVVAYCQTVRNDNAGLFTNVIDSEGLIDLPSFLETCCKKFSCPIIYYKGQRRDNDTVDIMRKLNRFLQANGLTKKNLITINFPADRNELLKCKASGFSPNNVIEVTVPKVVHSVPQKESKNSTTTEVETHFENNITRLSLRNRNDTKDNCDRLKHAIDQFDFRVLLLEYAKLNESFDERLEQVSSVHQLNRQLMASILFERITKRDCLENGWILVGYVSSVTDLEIMEKQFFIIPNKIIFIHCRQHLCLDRLRTRVIKNAEINEKCRLSYSKDAKYAKLGFLDLYSPCCAINHIVTEIDHFCRHRRSILKYCQDHAKYIAHIDGEHSVSTVKTMLWGQLEKFNF